MEVFELKNDPYLEIFRQLVEAYQAIFQIGIDIFVPWV